MRLGPRRLFTAGCVLPGTAAERLVKGEGIPPTPVGTPEDTVGTSVGGPGRGLRPLAA